MSQSERFQLKFQWWGTQINWHRQSNRKQSLLCVWEYSVISRIARGSGLCISLTKTRVRGVGVVSSSMWKPRGFSRAVSLERGWKLPQKGLKWKSEVAQLYPSLCDPIDCSPPGSSIHGIFQARVLEWVAISLKALYIGKAFLSSHKNILDKSSFFWPLQQLFQQFLEKTSKTYPLHL